jgi:hypothetical protein
MPQRNDEEVGKQPRLFFSPALSVWGQMVRAWTTGGRNAPRTTESITEKDYFAFFHQFFGLTNNTALAPFANVPCTFHWYFMGGEATSTPGSTMFLIGPAVSGTSWVVKVPGTTSTPTSTMLLTGPIWTEWEGNELVMVQGRPARWYRMVGSHHHREDRTGSSQKVEGTTDSVCRRDVRIHSY